MFIRFRCPACRRRAKASPERVGAVAKCAHCGALLRVPAIAPTPEGSETIADGELVAPPPDVASRTVAETGSKTLSEGNSGSAGGSKTVRRASLLDYAAAAPPPSATGLSGVGMWSGAQAIEAAAASRSGIMPAVSGKTSAGGSAASVTNSGSRDDLHIPDSNPEDDREPLPPGTPLKGEPVDPGTLPSCEQYVKFAAQSGLIDRDSLRTALLQFEAHPLSGAADARRLGTFLVEAKLLTAWQDRMLRRGLYKGFFLQRYRLLKLLGAGGMGSVFLAEHTMMRRLVAIKILQSAKSTHLQRFYRESQTTAQLDHPNVVKVFDFDASGESYYMVLEFVDGPNFHDHTMRAMPLTYATAAGFISQAAAGLHYAHQLGLVHRDIKPANLLLNPKGTVKISDLGLARLVEMEGPSVTVEEGGLLGTTDYLAPEQALDSSAVDGRADIYALGCTLFFLLTGRPPYHTGSMAQRLLMHQMQPAPRLKQIRPDTPPELQAICDAMMAKSPGDRPSAAQVRQRLAMFVALHPDLPAARGK